MQQPKRITRPTGIDWHASMDVQAAAPTDMYARPVTQVREQRPMSSLEVMAEEIQDTIIQGCMARCAGQWARVR